MYNETRGKIHFWASLIFFNVTFFPMHFLGLAGMPRRYADYPMQFTDFNMIASIGAFGFGLSQVYFLFFVDHADDARQGRAGAAAAVGRRRGARVGRAVAGAVPHLRDAAAAEQRRHQDRRRPGAAAPRRVGRHRRPGLSDARHDARAARRPTCASALILASIALVFFIGFIAKSALLLRGCRRMSPRHRSRRAALVADNRRMVGKLLVVAVLMFGFGYALVPIYRTICEALGINVLSRCRGAGGAGAAARRQHARSTLSRTVTIEFDANARGPWDFKPAQALGRRPSGRGRRR